MPPSTATDAMNVMTIDLEEWFVVQALESEYGINRWHDQKSTIVANTRRVLELLRRHDVRATFFVLGWCAKEHPGLIKMISDQGHEIGCHSYYHRRIDLMQPDEFRRDTLRAMHAIMEACGARPRGYRAPSWSINHRIPWAFEILSELGFEYDSSIFPIKHDLYGMPDGPRHLFLMKCKNDRYLYEIPASTYRFLGKNMPAAGGGYLRHMPYWYTQRVVRRMNHQNQPAIVYIHPWELDPNPPMVEGLSLLQRLRSHGSTNLLAIKLNKLLNDFAFTTMSHYLARVRSRAIGFR